jgi:hypothetical protein
MALTHNFGALWVDRLRCAVPTMPVASVLALQNGGGIAPGLQSAVHLLLIPSIPLHFSSDHIPP